MCSLDLSQRCQVSIIAKGYKSKSYAKRVVFLGKKMKTVGGLKKENLIKSKSGKIVSKKASLVGKKNKWIAAVAKARKALGVKGFAAVGGKTAKGQALYKKAKSFY